MNKKNIRLFVPLICFAIVGISVMKHFVTLGGQLPFAYGVRIRMGAEKCDVLRELWADYRSGKAEAKLTTFEKATDWCPGERSLNKIFEGWDTYNKNLGME